MTTEASFLESQPIYRCPRCHRSGTLERFYRAGRPVWGWCCGGPVELEADYLERRARQAYLVRD